MTKPIIVVKMPCKLLYVIQVKIKCSTSWPYLISEFLVVVASDLALFLQPGWHTDIHTTYIHILHTHYTHIF